VTYFVFLLFRTLYERAPDLYFYSTQFAHFVLFCWAIASTVVGSVKMDECTVEPLIPAALVGQMCFAEYEQSLMLAGNSNTYVRISVSRARIQIGVK
jgi:hypothetical protein